MTVYTWARPRRLARLPPAEPRYFAVDDDSRVLAHCYWRSRRRERATLVALHGLEGSSSAHYMRGLADKALSAGWNAVLLNQRNCGGTEQLTPGLYHSGLTADPLRVLRELVELDRLPALVVVGYSLGGNLALKLSGELGATDLPELRATCAVSPTMDLERCVDALESPGNRIYERHFVWSLKARLRRKHRYFPDRYDLSGLSKVRTVREFDDAYTAPHHGFDGAADYYFRASSLRVVARIGRPALVIAAEDDPFVPPGQFDRPEVAGNPWIQRVVTPHGGHCGFVAERADGFDGYWAEAAAVEFGKAWLKSAANSGPLPSSSCLK
jgi:hypothetical protein